MLKICRSLEKSKFYVEQDLDCSMYIVANLDKFLKWQKKVFDNIIFNIVYNIPCIKDRERFEITYNKINIRFIENESFKRCPSFTIYDKIKNKVLRGFNIVDMMHEFSSNLLKENDNGFILSNKDCNSRVIVVTARKIEILNNMSSNFKVFIYNGLRYDSLLYLNDDYLEKTITAFFQ